MLVGHYNRSKTLRTATLRTAKRSNYLSTVIRFLPLLILYHLIILMLTGNRFQGDEGDYVRFAINLSQGYYSPPDQIDLWFGPGYPLVLLPYVLLELPWLAAKLMNALLLFSGVLYAYHTFQCYAPKRTALFFSYLLGIYPPFLIHLPLLYTETLAVFLICGFQFHLCKAYQNSQKSWTNIVIASAYLGYLALTKVFFGYVILTGLLLFFVLYLWQKSQELKKELLIYTFALIFCIPYLFYTFTLTKKFFYWGNSGGMSLYWMSTPYKNEFGDWQSVGRVWNNPQLSKNHKKFFDELQHLSPVQRDDEFKRQAIAHIFHHPKKFLENYLANINRLLFNYPYSYTLQKLSTSLYIIPNMFLITLSILCIYIGYVGHRLMLFEIYSLALFFMVSFMGTSLLSAYSRQFIPLVPILTLWICFTLSRFVHIKT